MPEEIGVYERRVKRVRAVDGDVAALNVSSQIRGRKEGFETYALEGRQRSLVS